MIAKNNKPFQTVSPAALPKLGNLGIGGVAGVGKTFLLGTVGKGNKALVFDTEGGSVTYNNPDFEASPSATEASNIDVVTFDDVSDASALLHRIEGAFDYLIRSKNSDGYSVVALDSLTELQQKFLMLHSAPDPRQSYGAFKDGIYRIVTKARSVPAHTVFTARLRSTQDEVLGQEIVRFDVAPSVWGLISGLFDAVGYMTTKNQGKSSKRVLDFRHTPRAHGKDRLGLGVGELSNPVLSDLLTLIEEGAEVRDATPKRRRQRRS